ncbi:MAG: hypothetical protein ACI8VI_000620, partial [Granulosicoccus sp.]
MELSILIRNYLSLSKSTALFITLFICFQSLASTKLSFEDYAQLPNTRFMTISSDGQRLAYLKSMPDGERVMIIDKKSLS